jgi:cytochrome c oxidase assembly protein Cox11
LRVTTFSLFVATICFCFVTGFMYTAENVTLPRTIMFLDRRVAMEVSALLP